MLKEPGFNLILRGWQRWIDEISQWQKEPKTFLRAHCLSLVHSSSSMRGEGMLTGGSWHVQMIPLHAPPIHEWYMDRGMCLASGTELGMSLNLWLDVSGAFYNSIHTCEGAVQWRCTPKEKRKKHGGERETPGQAARRHKAQGWGKGSEGWLMGRNIDGQGRILSPVKPGTMKREEKITEQARSR